MMYFWSSNRFGNANKAAFLFLHESFEANGHKPQMNGNKKAHPSYDEWAGFENLISKETYPPEYKACQKHLPHLYIQPLR